LTSPLLASSPGRRNLNICFHRFTPRWYPSLTSLLPRQNSFLSFLSTSNFLRFAPLFVLCRASPFAVLPPLRPQYLQSRKHLRLSFTWPQVLLFPRRNLHATFREVLFPHAIDVSPLRPPAHSGLSFCTFFGPFSGSSFFGGGPDRRFCAPS